MPNQTKGQYRVGQTFNPSGLAIVNEIKAASAEHIDQIGRIEVPQGSSDIRQAEIGRQKAHAQTLVHDACMNAVGAATKPEIE